MVELLSASLSICRKPLNVGIVGCGAVTDLYYAPALNVLERARVLKVSALFDPEGKNMRQVGAKIPGAALARTFEELLQMEVALVIVASPPQYHAGQTIQALRAGKAVLCEKPLATTLADGQSMVDTAVDASRLLAVGLIRRYFPAVRAIKTALASGMLGQLRAFRCFEGGPFQWPARSDAYFDNKSAGGGVFLDIGPHILDLLNWWLGVPAEIVYEDDAVGGVEANCRIRLVYDGFCGDVRLSRDWERPNRYLFQGSRGWLGWAVNEADRIEIGFSDSGYAAAARLHEATGENGSVTLGRPAANFHQSFVEQVRSVVAAVHGDNAPIVSGVEALESVQLIEHCYRHRALLPMPWLSEREWLGARQLADS